MATTDPRTSVAEIDPDEGLVYDGFISYSHAADDLLAPRLQAGLQRFAKPWWKRRALRIFRDESSLAANPHLWSSITDALDQSGWFILLLSPAAASSEWVNKEIEYWLGHKDPNRIIPVVTDGEFGWSSGDIAGDSSPPAFGGVFADEPRWVDLRFARTEEQLDLNNASFRAAVADVASAIRQVPKDELESEEVRQHRRTTRTAWAAALALLLLGVGATAAAAFAVAQSNEARVQRDEAERQTDIAEDQTQIAEEQRSEAEAQTEIAQQERDRAELNALEAISARLITESEAARVSDPAVADLLAVEARRRIDIEVTRANLARGTLSAAAIDLTRMPRKASGADVSPAGDWAVAAYITSSGGVVEDVDLVAQRPGDRRMEFPGATFAIPDLSEDGSRLVVMYRDEETFRTDAVVLDANTFDPVADPIAGPLSSVAISPDGSLLAVAPTRQSSPVGTVELIRVGGEVVTTLPAGGDGQIDPGGLVFSSDGRRLLSVQLTSDASVLKVWDVATGELLFRRSFEPLLFSNVAAISPEGRYVAVPSGGTNFLGTQQSVVEVIVLDGETGTDIAQIALDTFDPNGISVGFGTVEPVLAIGDSSGTSIVSTETFDIIRRIDHATGAVFRVSFRDQDRKLVALGATPVVTRISLTVDRSGSVALPVAGITALSPVDDTIAVVESDGSVSFWSARRGNQIGTADVSVSGTSDLARTQGAVSDIGGVPVFSADGTRLYVRDSESHFSVVDVASGDVVAEVDLPVGRTQSALAASGAFIATGHSDGTVMLWAAASFGSTDEPIAAWQLIDEVGACATGSDPASTGIRLIGMKESTSGLLLRVIDECGTATGWEIIDPKPVNDASFANAFVVDFGSDDSYLVSQQGTRLRLLTEDGTVVRDFDAHSEEIRQTSTSRDLGTMASVSRDLIGLWYTRSGESLASGITGSQAHVAGDGSFVVTSGGSGFDWFGGPVVVWDLDPDTWEEQACEAAGRNLSFFEWEQFFPTEVYRLTCPQWPSGL